MSADYEALAAAVVAGLPEVSACVLLSRDGLALASHPPEEEHRAVEQWARLASMGEVVRGFVVVGQEAWVFVRQGRHVALAVAEASGRPGAVLVELEEAVRAAEQVRTTRRRESARENAAGPEHARRRRISLHPARKPRAPAATTAAVEPAPDAPAQEVPAGTGDPVELVREFGGLLFDPREDRS